MSLDLDPDVEGQVQARAQAEGMNASDYIARLLQATTPIVAPGPVAQVHDLLKQWQQQDNTPTAAPAPNDGTLTPSEALFRQWDQEDATLSDAERAAQEEQWRLFQHDINTVFVNAVEWQSIAP